MQIKKKLEIQKKEYESWSYKWSNIHLQIASKGKDKNHPEEARYKEIMAKNVPELM